jgi:hypothetical protein
MIKRTADATLKKLSKLYPIVAITGPRQSGKTTLTRHVFKNKPYISLEEPDQKLFADEDPRGFLKQFSDGAILDEVQRCPKIFSYLQSLVDHDRRPGLFILTGSQQFGLLSNISQTLAGRVGLVQLLPFSLHELQSARKTPKTIEELLFKGLYPPIYDRRIPPTNWYSNYVLTYIERDVRQMINVHDLSAFQRFVRMCAARTGQLLNLSSLAIDCGITHNTAKAWLSVLEASYIVFLLRPYFQNINKRLIKTPKLYFYDTGLAAWLMGIHESNLLAIHAMRGALFETWTIGELLKNRLNRGLPSNLFFFRDNVGNEVDVVLEEGGQLTPIEIKSGETITGDYFTGLTYWTKLPLKTSGKKWLIYGGDQRQTRQGVEILPWQQLGKTIPS